MAIVLDGNNLTTTGMINSFTAVNSTSGTSIDFTGIPTGVKRVTVMFQGISTNGTSLPRFQLGSGSVATSGYLTVTGYTGSSSGAASSTGGWDMYGDAGVSALRTGQMVFTLLGSNLWVGTGLFDDETSSGYVWLMSGKVTLSGALDRVRITTVNGTDTFDAGSINVLYE